MNNLLDNEKLHSIFSSNKYEEEYKKKNTKYFNNIEQIIKQNNLSIQDVLENYPAFIRRKDLPRVLAYYELYKLIEHMPGSIVDLGVFRGAGFFNWINLLETFAPGDRMRKVYGFDHFEGFEIKDKNEKTWLSSHCKEGLLEDCNDHLIKELLKLHNEDSYLPGVDRGKLVEGNVLETIPKFYEKNMGIRLSLLYLDINLYEPTKIALDYLYDLIIPGGVIAFNGYGAAPWDGEAKAFEAFIRERDLKIKIKKFQFSPMPRGYFIKE